MISTHNLDTYVDHTHALKLMHSLSGMLLSGGLLFKTLCGIHVSPRDHLETFNKETEIGS